MCWPWVNPLNDVASQEIWELRHCLSGDFSPFLQGVSTWECMQQCPSGRVFSWCCVELVVFFFVLDLAEQFQVNKLEDITYKNSLATCQTNKCTIMQYNKIQHKAIQCITLQYKHHNANKERRATTAMRCWICQICFFWGCLFTTKVHLTNEKGLGSKLQKVVSLTQCWSNIQIPNVCAQCLTSTCT